MSILRWEMHFSSVKCKSQEMWFLRILTFPQLNAKAKRYVFSDPWLFRYLVQKPISDPFLMDTRHYTLEWFKINNSHFSIIPPGCIVDAQNIARLGAGEQRACVLIWGRQTTVESCSNNLIPLEMNEVHHAYSSSRLSWEFSEEDCCVVEFELSHARRIELGKI